MARKQLFKVMAKVDQIVTREIMLEVMAETSEEAEKFSREALQVYPQAVADVPEVKTILTVNQTYWIPKSIDFNTSTIPPKKENKA